MVMDLGFRLSCWTAGRRSLSEEGWTGLCEVVVSWTLMGKIGRRLRHPPPCNPCVFPCLWGSPCLKVIPLGLQCPSTCQMAMLNLSKTGVSVFNPEAQPVFCRQLRTAWG